MKGCWVMAGITFREAARKKILWTALIAGLGFLVLFGLALPQVDGLDRYRPADSGIDGVVNHAHGATPQFPDDLIPADAVHLVHGSGKGGRGKIGRAHV